MVRSWTWRGRRRQSFRSPAIATCRFRSGAPHLSGDRLSGARALANHRWYHDKFGAEYPAQRRAVIPCSS
ncbi:MAG: hypothetical protein ACREXY_11330 [Gammaproteobacteria bacterium]